VKDEISSITIMALH